MFGTIAAVIDGEVRLAYAPVILDPQNGPKGGIRFHFARGNAMAAMEDGAHVKLSFVAADAYISPDWYKTLVTVPTWNYIAVEGKGVVRRTSREELRQLVVELSAQEEAKLVPKTPWLLDKVPEQRTEALLNGIVGFSLVFDTLAGKLKLSQDKKPEDVAGVIEGLEARGDVASLAIASAMKRELAIAP